MSTYELIDELHQALIDYYGGEFNYLMACLVTDVNDLRQVTLDAIAAMADWNEVIENLLLLLDND